MYIWMYLYLYVYMYLYLYNDHSQNSSNNNNNRYNKYVGQFCNKVEMSVLGEGSGVGGAAIELQHTALRVVNAPTSPYSLAPLLASTPCAADEQLIDGQTREWLAAIIEPGSGSGSVYPTPLPCPPLPLHPSSAALQAEVEQLSALVIGPLNC